MRDVGTISESDFTPHLNEKFHLTAADGADAEAELIEVRKTGGDAVEESMRAPFFALFRTPSDFVVRQQMFRLEHETFGSIAVFLVPVGPDKEGMRYEAVFS